MIPHTRPGEYPANIPPARFAAHIHQGLPVGCRVAILGLADDTGVRLNGGRPGAAEGPRAFRAALARYGVQEPRGAAWPRVYDAGDVIPEPGADVLTTHERVEAAAGALLDAGLLPIGIGGGHDLTLPLVRAVSRRTGSLAGVYYDAHLDVRETVGSGMAFRRIIEECGVRELHVVGLDPMVNERAHVEWFERHGGVVHAREERAAPMPAIRAGALFASFDLDAIDAAHAPGVSAMNPAGMGSREAAAAAHALGRDPRVRCFDLMELCPAHDEQGRTARLAAHLFLSFLRGFAERPA